MLKSKGLRSAMFAFGGVAMLAPLSYAPDAKADTAQICTFASDDAKMNYHDGYSRDPLTFKWNNSTGAVLSGSWTTSGVPYTLVAANSSVQPGFNNTWTLLTTRQIDLHFTHPSFPGVEYVIAGPMVNRGPAGNAGISAIQYGTNNSWIAGYGTVTCVDE